MNCKVCRKFLPLFIDFPLPDKQRAQIEKHLNACEICRKELKALSDTINLVQRIPASRMPEDFLPRLRARLKSESSQRHEWRLWNPWAWGTIAATAMVLLTLVLYQPFNHISSPRDEHISSIPPAPAVKVKTPAMVSVPDMVPPAWSESDAPLLEKYKRNINSIFKLNQTVQPPVNLPPSKKHRLYQAVGYSSGSDNLVRRSEEHRPIPETNRVFRQKGEWTGELCHITSPRNLTLRNSEDLKTLWQEAKIKSISMPTLDWTKQMLGAIFLGEQPGREYEIHLNEIHKFHDRLVVKYRVIAPRENSNQETTCPFLLFTLPVSSLPVEFIIENQP